MLTRSKIKMEDSFKEVHQNMATYGHDSYGGIKQVQSGNIYVPSHQQARYTSYKTTFTQDSNRPQVARNQILKQLRQQYQILRNLSIEESQHIPMKQLDQKSPQYDQRSDMSSSMASRQDRKRGKEPKQSSRQVQTLHLEKKQLELVIGNSMRKIQELLNNQITLKKTIHELKTQIDGKGGISMEYQKTIKNLQKNEEDLQGELSRFKHENDKNIQRIRELNDKVRSLESEIEAKDRQVKGGFEEQHRFHELLRIQKDKYLNLQIQYRSLKMELQMLQKEKNTQINRIMRQFQSKDGFSDKELSYKIRKLEEEVREKDKRYHQLLLQKERRKERESEVISLDKKQKDGKTYLEELLERSRSMNQNSNKAITDGMNMIFAKMSEIQKRNQLNLKKQIQDIKKKVIQDTKQKSFNLEGRQKEQQFFDRIVELQTVIQKQTTEKNRLLEEIRTIQDHRAQVLDQNQRHGQRIRKLEQRQSDLLEQINMLEEVKQNYDITLKQYNILRAEHQLFIQKMNQNEKSQDKLRGGLQPDKFGFREKEKKYEEQIRLLKRRVDQAEFQADKNKKEGQFNINMYRTSQQSEMKRLNAENQRIMQRCRQAQGRLAQIERELDTKVRSKDNQLSQNRAAIQSVSIKAQQDLISQKKHYEQKIGMVESRHTQELKVLNEKFMSLTSANEKMVSQLSHIGMLESQVLQLRRILRVSRSTNAGIDHLWSVKQAEYQNIAQILKVMHDY